VQAEVLVAIAERIRTDPDAVLRHCSDGEKRLLAEAVFGGPVNPTVFRGKYGLGLPPRPSQYRDKMECESVRAAMSSVSLLA
jgi:hypothetical protein